MEIDLLSYISGFLLFIGLICFVTGKSMMNHNDTYENGLYLMYIGISLFLILLILMIFKLKY